MKQAQDRYISSHMMFAIHVPPKDKHILSLIMPQNINTYIVSLTVLSPPNNSQIPWTLYNIDEHQSSTISCKFTLRNINNPPNEETNLDSVIVLCLAPSSKTTCLLYSMAESKLPLKWRNFNTYRKCLPRTVTHFIVRYVPRNIKN